MAGFFSLLIGYIVFLIMTNHEVNKKLRVEEREREGRKQTAIKNNKRVYFYDYEKNLKIYEEIETGKKLFVGTDKTGRKRWYYKITKAPMQYSEDKRIMESIERNQTMAYLEGKKWCIAEHFWDDSLFEDVRDSRGNILFVATLPKGFLNDDRLNQKVYLKNMRPYQLHLIGFTGKEQDYCPFVKKQYLIRFGNPLYFNLRTQHCISDKNFDSVPPFWSKWYAITDEEYLELISPDELTAYRNKTECPSDLQYYHPINVKDIAFNEGIKDVDWDLEDCGIIKAFDREGNFVGP